VADGNFSECPSSFGATPIWGFPDDLDAPGPTVISTATLAEVASWLAPLDVKQTETPVSRQPGNRRLSAVLGGSEACTARRIARAISHRRLLAGRQQSVPALRRAARDPGTGEGFPDFAVIFRKQREKTLPDWAERSRFDHF